MKSGRKRVRRLMRQMGLTALYRKPQTSSPDGSHRIYPYRPDAEVSIIWWRSWTGRRAPCFRGGCQITQDSAFCREALQEALARDGKPDIFNTDQSICTTFRMDGRRIR